MRCYLVANAERDNIYCPVKVLPPNTHCGRYTTTLITTTRSMKLHIPLTDRVLNNGSYCDNNGLPFVGKSVNYNICDNVPDDQCPWNPCESP